MQSKKVALVTGASRGIGKAIAKAFAAEGYLTILNYNGSKDAAEKVKEEIEQSGGTACVLPCDISNYEKVRDMIKQIKTEYGSIDVLVNNAGITRDGLLASMKEEDFTRVIQTNLQGTFCSMRFVSRIMMKQRQGCIINLSSISGVVGNAGQCNYAASKAGVIGLTKSAAKELANWNIRVNAIAPGFVETDMTASLPKEIRQTVEGQIPLKRFAAPEEIAQVALFLASEQASYITGQVLCVDGGLTMVE